MGLSERIEKNVDLTYYEGQIPVNYVYTYGLGLETFFRGLMKGDFLASRCPACGTVYVPCRIFCEKCFAEMPRTFKVPGSGTVYSFTVCHYNMDGSMKDKPDVVGLVEMDGGQDRYEGQAGAEEPQRAQGRDL
jgi:uncharacterized OB-fold protein